MTNPAPAKVVFEPGGYARFSGTTVPESARLQALIGVFMGEMFQSARAKLTVGLFLLPPLVSATIAVVRSQFEAIAVPAGQEVASDLELLSWVFAFNCAFLLQRVASHVAPQIARDAHQGALLLYFSRPVLPSHYLLARLAAVFFAHTALMALPAVLLIAVLASQHGLQPGGCPWHSSGTAGPWLGALWWLALAAAAVAASALMALATALAALAAGVLVRNPSAAPLAFGGTVLGSIAGSWVLQAAWGRDTVARALDLHKALRGLWTLPTWPLEPGSPPQVELHTAAGGMLVWLVLSGIAWWALQRFLANPPLGKGRA